MESSSRPHSRLKRLVAMPALAAGLLATSTVATPATAAFEQVAATPALPKVARVTTLEKKPVPLRDRWVVPVSGYRITATFGNTGLWAGTHTGIDFAAPSGTAIRSVTSGVVTEVGYDGAYGNKTVVRMKDGTELWYCHQASLSVSVGERVMPGDVIGAVGSTGNVTGPHLHLEVRPTLDRPVDPYTVLTAHGLRL
ncbi:MAG TPA: M23 family metallopeptidase [Nocardioidaceae bacterium]|nr:M23 family metallopeptidase [Nocardioidaceae bacterium]